MNDYKVFCYNGVAKCTLYVNDRKRDFYRMLFDKDWNKLPIQLMPLGDKSVPEKPKHYDKMIACAEKLAKPFGLVRVDFYMNGEELYVGEITHCHLCAFETFASKEEETLLSKVIFE